MAVLHAENYGPTEGPRLLTIHGITGHGRRFEKLATGPWAHRSVLSVDLRGHGRSLDGAPWHFEQHVADLLDTLDAAGWHEPVDVVGHSMGGAIATFLLASAPGRIRRLVLLDPALHRDRQLSYETARLAMAGNSYGSPDEVKVERRAALDPSGHWVIDDEVAHHVELGDDGRYHQRYRIAPVVAGWGELARVTPTLPQRRPTLLVVADRVDICPPEYQAALGEQLGAALTIEHLDCGHMVYWERFEETAGLVERFLS